MTCNVGKQAKLLLQKTNTVMSVVLLSQLLFPQMALSTTAKL